MKKDKKELIVNVDANGDMSMTAHNMSVIELLGVANYINLRTRMKMVDQIKSEPLKTP